MDTSSSFPEESPCLHKNPFNCTLAIRIKISLHNSHNFVNYNWCRCGHLNLSIKDLKKSNCLNSSPRLWPSFPVFATRAGTCSHWRNPWTSAVKWFTAFSRCYAILTGNNDNEHWTCSFCISLVGKATVFPELMFCAFCPILRAQNTFNNKTWLQQIISLLV